MTYQVLISTAKFSGYEDRARVFLRRHDCELIDHGDVEPMDEEALLRLAPAAAALIAGPEPVTDRVMAAAPLLRMINAPGVGFDHIDVAAATRRGIAVCVAAGCNQHAVAEMALGMMIGLARRICVADRAVREGRWPAETGPELWGKTLGIVGLGQIGKSLASIGKGLGMRVLATDSVPDPTFANEHGIGHVPLAELLQEADFVSLHCPLTPQTRGLIDAEALARMKTTAYLINTARGPLVDEAALARALRERRLAGAGLDVFAVEPPANNLFREFENVIMTPHRAGATPEAIERSLEVALTNATLVLHDRKPLYQING